MHHTSWTPARRGGRAGVHAALAATATVAATVALISQYLVPARAQRQSVAQPLDESHPAVFYFNDNGGSCDPDNDQALLHLLWYTDTLSVEGLVADGSTNCGAVTSSISASLDAYAADYGHLSPQRQAVMTAPAALRAVLVAGAQHSAPPSGLGPATNGSAALVAAARRHMPPAPPLWVMAGAGLSDIARAVNDAPDIVRALRLYSIGSWNTDQDPHARAWLASSPQSKDLWWIENNSTFRGMYMGGNQSGNLGDGPFVQHVVSPAGAMGSRYAKVSAALPGAQAGTLKEGDFPALLYFMSAYTGRFDASEPTAEHWGGRFARAGDGTASSSSSHQASELASSALGLGPRWGDIDEAGQQFPGADTVSRWRADFLGDWARRLAGWPVTLRHEATHVNGSLLDEGAPQLARRALIPNNGAADAVVRVNASITVVLDGGVGPFPRQATVVHHQHNSHHGVSDSHSTVTAQLATRPARWLKPDAQPVFGFVGCPEDTSAPGKPDLGYFRSAAVAEAIGSAMNATRDQWGAGTWDLEVCFESTEWPSYMLSRPNQAIPDDVNAAASMQVALLQAMHAGSGVLPSRVEPINEPDGIAVSTGANWSAVVALHAAVARTVDAAFGAGTIAVGGPTLSDTSFAHAVGGQPFGLLHDHVGQLLDAVPTLAFVSVHLFDTFKPAGVIHRKGGGHGHAVLDVLHAYTAARRQASPLPVLVSEHGFASDTPYMGHRSLLQLRSEQLTAHFSQLLVFLDRSEGLVSSSAFLLDNEYELRTNPSVALVNGTTGSATVVAQQVYAFMASIDGAQRLWSSVSLGGDRGGAAALKVSASAFLVRDGSVVVVAVSTETTPVIVDLSVAGSSASTASLQRLYYAAGSDQIAHEETVPVASLGTLVLHAGEVCVATLKPAGAATTAAAANATTAMATTALVRRTAYSRDAPVVADHGHGNTTIAVPAAASGAVVAAKLRVGYGRAAFESPAPAIPPPQVVFGGVTVPASSWVRLPHADTPAADTGHSSWACFEAPVPASAVRAGATVTVQLSTDPRLGGAWSAVALVVHSAS